MESEETAPNRNRFQKWRRTIVSPWYRYITVEPTMFLYMLAFMITTVVEQDFFIRKSCLVNEKFSIEICKNLNEYPDIKKEVQKTTAKFHQWENISAHVFPIILALFLGSWSDKRGRKFPLLMGLFGKFIYSIMVIVNANQPTWPVEYIIYTATIPSAITGADVAIFASCFAYISDVSSLNNRTIRITILDICYMSTMPIGVALGSYLFNNVFDKSYTPMFAINASLLLISFIYSAMALKWQTTEKQRSLREISCLGFIPDFFDMQHLRDSFSILIKKRQAHRRSFLTILLISMALYTFQRDEKPYIYLYTQFKFEWDVKIFSRFKTLQSGVYVIAMITAVPLMNKIFGWKDTTIIFIGAWAHTIARLFFYFAEIPELLYVGAIVGSLGPIVGPMIRSITSKIVAQSERGKVFALLAVCDNAVPFVSGVCYSQIYNATIGERSGVFLLTIATQLAVFFLVLGIHITLGNGELAVVEVERQNGLIPRLDYRGTHSISRDDTSSASSRDEYKNEA